LRLVKVSLEPTDINPSGSIESNTMLHVLSLNLSYWPLRKKSFNLNQLLSGEEKFTIPRCKELVESKATGMPEGSLLKTMNGA
jgi:hypothetical protein